MATLVVFKFPTAEGVNLSKEQEDQLRKDFGEE